MSYAASSADTRPLSHAARDGSSSVLSLIMSPTAAALSLSRRNAVPSLALHAARLVTVAAWCRSSSQVVSHHA